MTSTDFDETVIERTLVSSIVAAYSLSGMTPAFDDGPIEIGVAHSDYTTAEIKEFVDNAGSWNEGNLVQQEVAKRRIKRIGIFPVPDNADDAVVLNDGEPIKTKLNWMLMTGQTLKVWAFNLGDSSLATTNPQILTSGHVNLWPQ